MGEAPGQCIARHLCAFRRCCLCVIIWSFHCGKWQKQEFTLHWFMSTNMWYNPMIKNKASSLKHPEGTLWRYLMKSENWIQYSYCSEICTSYSLSFKVWELKATWQFSTVSVAGGKDCEIAVSCEWKVDPVVQDLNTCTARTTYWRQIGHSLMRLPHFVHVTMCPQSKRTQSMGESIQILHRFSSMAVPGPASIKKRSSHHKTKRMTIMKRN